MPDQVLKNTFHIGVEPKVVLDHLTTPENYIGLSPIVVAVKDVDKSTPGVVRYTATERFRFFGFIKWDNPIAVELFTDDSAVWGDVKSPGGVRMAYRFDLSAEGTGTRMDDVLNLSAPSLIIKYAASEARKVQLARARILVERLA
ncbi:SRPBCC family protein [Herbidospora galbida]|uniref:SRPBCC family protein n=1 Tax=Herbidospora galbida TaxID=2575442 RepID=A0A4U3MBY5_9ACTN|nr:SRPBCC family protein [Herbidospora galbida]TKK85869.1 SRPBCC family protein [Herbidospora galbida]